MTFLILLVKGFIMGVAFIIPGVSGGTLAVYLGIYQKLIEAISNIFKDFKNSIKFLFPIFLGIAISVVSLAKLFSILLNWNSVIILFFFIGLIAGGVRHIYNKAEGQELNSRKIIAFIIAFFVLLVIIILEKVNTGSGIAYFDMKFGTYVLLVILGILASITMIVPGISGSAVLLVLGFYTAIVSNVVGNIFDFSNLVYNLQVIIPFAVGAIIGVVLFSKLVEKLLRKYPKETYFAILGFIIASIIGVFLEIKDPATAASFDQQIPIYKDLLNFISDSIWSVAGGLIALGFGYFGSRFLIKHEGDKANG